MKKWIGGLLVILLLGLAACAKPTATQDNRLKVVASFYTLADFAKKIGGSRAAVTTLVPAGTEPHDWEPTAADLALLESADVFIYNGAGMEHWVSDVLAGLANKKLVVVEASKNIPLLGSDPHVWLNPLYAKIEMENIQRGFSEADPLHRESYTQSYTKFAALLEQLDRKYKNMLMGVQNTNIVVSHEAYGYLCAAYGLNQVALTGLSADDEPDAARMAELAGFVQENHVKVIFFEELVSSKTAEALARETGVTTKVLDPIEGITEKRQAAGEDYFSLMENNLSALLEALN